MINQYLAYLNGCYTSDNRQLQLFDLFGSSRVEMLMTMEGEEELANGNAPKLAIPSEYGEEVAKPSLYNVQEERNHDLFMNEVQQVLEKMSLTYWTYFSIAGVPIDLLIIKGDKVLGIDLIGYPGKYQDALSVERFKILGRAGVRVFPLPYSFWKLQREESERQLHQFLMV